MLFKKTELIFFSSIYSFFFYEKSISNAFLDHLEAWIFKIAPSGQTINYLRDTWMIFESNRSTSDKLNEVNNIHPSLQFMIERDNNYVFTISWLKLIKRYGTKLSSEWYTKPIDTGLTMNYNALALGVKVKDICFETSSIQRSASNQLYLKLSHAPFRN